jgi:putative spermidine/putrescine transport system permease protein
MASGWLAAWLPAIPLMLLTFALLLAPAVLLLVKSVTSPEDGSLTLANWVTSYSNRNDQRAITTSVELGVVCATISLLVGAPLAWIISRMLPARRATWLALLNVAANFGGIGLAFAFTATLGTVGMLTLALAAIGMGITPPAPSSFAGLVMGYEYSNIPLYVLLTIPAMGVLRNEWWEAAQTASSTRLQFWRYIGLPVLSPFLAAGWLLIFTWSIGIFGLAYGLAGRTGNLTTRLITLQIGFALDSSAVPEERAAVLAVTLMLLATLSLLAYRRLLRWALRWF